MRKYILNFIFILYSSIGFAQWQWANHIGGVGQDFIRSTLDANDNSYCTGDFDSPCYFQTDTLIPNGDNDLYLAKYDVNGNEIWVKGFGGNNPSSFDEAVRKIIVDNNNNCLYTTGAFWGTMTIDAQTAVSSGGYDMYVAKFDLNGICQWIKVIGGALTDYGVAMSVDGQGNIICLGVAGTSLSIDGFSFLPGTFFAKISPSGTLILLKNNFLTGALVYDLEWVNNSITFVGETINDTCIVDTSMVIGQPNSDALIARLDGNGNSQWLKLFGYTGSEKLEDFVIDNSGNIIVAGAFNDSIALDTIKLFTNGNADILFCKLDSNGNVIWANQTFANGNSGAFSNSISLDSNGDYYLAGRYEGTAQFGTFQLISSGTFSMFLARYDANGNCLGVRRVINANSSSLNCNSHNHPVVAGRFINTSVFGSTSMTSFGSFYDTFIAQCDEITGIEEEIGSKPSNQLLIYANPNSGTFKLKLPYGINPNEEILLIINDINGKEIYRRRTKDFFENSKIEIPYSKDGQYSVNLIQGYQIYAGKLIITN